MLSSGTAFYIIFAALYLLESVILCRDGVVIFHRGLFRGYRYTLGKNLPHFGRFRMFLSPLMPSSPVYVAGSMPVIFSPDGFMASPGNNSAQESIHLFLYDDVKRIGSVQNTITINGRTFCKTHNETEALLWKERLLTMARSKAGDRDYSARRVLDEIFMSENCSMLTQSIKRNTVVLSILNDTLFWYCFILVPCVSWYLSIAETWTTLLLAFFILDALTLAAFIISYKKIYKPGRVPFSRIIMMITYPPSLLRCMDSIRRTAFIAYHPVAVSRGFKPETIHRQILSCYYRLYTFAPAVQTDEAAGRILNWYSKNMREHIEAAAGESGITSGMLIAPPEIMDEEIKTYCPLCHEQYVLESGSCSECGIELESYAKSTREYRQKQ